MSDYTPITDFSAKDALTTGDPEKIILGADIDGEFTAIQTAIATKYDSDDLASQAQAQAETSNTVLMTPLRVANWADANAGIVGDLQAKADPNADQLLGWDDSAGAAIGFTLTAPLAFNNTAIEISGLTASVSELNVLDGITASTAELNILDGVTLTASQINDAARKTAANTFTSKNTFTQVASGANGLEFNSILPGFWLVETDASADNQDWRVSVDAGVFRVALSNGARNSVANVFQIARNANTATEIQLDATLFDFNGAMDLSENIAVGTSSGQTRFGVTSAGVWTMNTNVSNSANAGAATLPSNPAGFLEVVIGGTTRKIPYYAD